MIRANTAVAEQLCERQQSVTLISPIQQAPDKLRGMATIGAKRVPAAFLIDYLAGGQTVQEFVDDYDAVTEAEALAVLAIVKQAINDGALTGMQVRDEDTF